METMHGFIACVVHIRGINSYSRAIFSRNETGSDNFQNLLQTIIQGCYILGIKQYTCKIAQLFKYSAMDKIVGGVGGEAFTIVQVPLTGERYVALGGECSLQLWESRTSDFA